MSGPENHGLESYLKIDSFVHRLDARTKLITTAAFILTVNLVPTGRWLAFAAYFVFISLLVLLSRVPVTYIFKRSLMIMPVVFLIAIFIPFFREGEIAGSINIGLWQISVTKPGIQVMLNVLAKAWLSILGLVLLTSTTSITDLLEAMLRLRLPRVMVTILSFMYRYIFVLAEEVRRMKQARDSRNFSGSRLRQVKTIGSMVGTLFIRSYERAERIYAAMLSRGFDGHVRKTGYPRFRLADTCFGISYTTALILVVVFSLVNG